MADKGRLVECRIESSGGMTGGTYGAVVRRSPRSGRIMVIIRQRPWFNAPVKTIRRKLSEERFGELEEALAAFDFERKAPQELIDERSQWIALDAPEESVTVRYERVRYLLTGNEVAVENIPARQILTEFFDSFEQPE